jgi:hypothetical protein
VNSDTFFQTAVWTLKDEEKRSFYDRVTIYDHLLKLEIFSCILHVPKTAFMKKKKVSFPRKDQFPIAKYFLVSFCRLLNI